MLSPICIDSYQHVLRRANSKTSGEYVDYRRRGGTRRSPIGDFYIGAHAAIAGYRLLTRDTSRYSTYFPTVRLLAPEG